MTQYIIRNPNNPIVRDLYKDIPLVDAQGNVVTDSEGRIVCDRYIVQGSVGVSEEAVDTKIKNLGSNFVDTTSTQTVGGNKAFSGAVTVPTVATDNNSNHAASTAFVQNVLSTISGSSVDNLVTKNTAQTITAIKTFNTLPQSSAVPTDNKDLVNKKYVDDNKISTDDCVKTSGDQTVAGIKTFSSVPVCATNPTANNQLANKSYVDTTVNAKPSKYLGEQIVSYLPLSDVKAHLLDGAVLNNTNYPEFITYVEALYTSNPNLSCFTTESTWQANVTANGVCSKFVVNKTNHTVRLPKMGSQILTKGKAQSISAKTLSADIGLGTSTTLSGSTGASSVICGPAGGEMIGGVNNMSGGVGLSGSGAKYINGSSHTHTLSGSMSGSASINQNGLNTIASSLSVTSSHFENVYYYIVVKTN